MSALPHVPPVECKVKALAGFEQVGWTWIAEDLSESWRIPQEEWNRMVKDAFYWRTGYRHALQAAVSALGKKREHHVAPVARKNASRLGRPKFAKPRQRLSMIAIRQIARQGVAQSQANTLSNRPQAASVRSPPPKPIKHKARSGRH
jgi:hypothetical protein